MKYIFAISLVVLLILSGVAWTIRPKAVQDGRPVLLWLVDDNDQRREQAALFRQQYPQYQLNIDPGATEMTKVTLQCLAGVGPDLFLAYNGMELSSYVKAGIALDLTDELPKLGIDMKSDVWGAAGSCVTYEGRIYGFPKNVCTDALWYNKDLFDQAGLPYPKGPMTWEDFIPLAQKLTLRDERGRICQYGLILNWPTGDGGPWLHFIRQWGGRVYSEDGTRCTLDSPECIAAMQFLQDLIYKHQVMPSPNQEESMASAGGWGTGSISWFASARAATAIGGNYWIISLKNYPKLRYGVAESPHGPLRQYRGYGSAVIINKSSPRQREALDFIRYLASQPYAELLARQADGLAPIKKFSFTDGYLNASPAFTPEQNAVWRDVMQFGVTDENSPFINGVTAALLIYNQIDLIKNNTKSAAQAMRDAAREVNKEIRKSIEREPSLKARYEELTRHSATGVGLTTSDARGAEQ